MEVTLIIRTVVSDSGSDNSMQGMVKNVPLTIASEKVRHWQ